MSAEPRTLKTEAELSLVEEYRAARRNFPGSPAVAARRDEAFARFDRQGLPHRRVEAWKYTDLRALMRRAAPIAPPPGALAVAAALDGVDAFPGVERYRLVLADGRFQEAASDREALIAEGVGIATLSEFLGFQTPRVLDILDTPPGAGDDAMIALNAALATDGVVVIVPAGKVLSRPIEIIHLTTGASPVAWFTRSAVQCGAGAEVKLLLTRSGPDDVNYQANSVLGIAGGEGARMTVVDLQADGNAAQHVATFSARVAANGSLDHLAVVAGSGLSRLQGFVALEGEGARLTASAANMLGGKAHGDVAMVIDHTAPATTSRVLYKNVVRDDATGSFEGRIIVRQAAQKTDGRMLTNTLILSDNAEFAAKPELEIYADDVQCGHGSTTGQIDENLLFYFRARGVPRAEAEALLLKSFLAEAIEKVGDAAIAAALDPLLTLWLKGAGL